MSNQHAVACPHNAPNYVLVVVHFLQEHDFTKCALCVCRVLKRVEDLLQRDGVPRFLIDGFPDDAVRLRGARRRSARFRRPRCATPGRKANDSSVAYPFPQLLLDLILPQHVLVYFFAHDSWSRARSALERRRRAARLRVGLEPFPKRLFLRTRTKEDS